MNDVAAALARAQALGVARLDAQLLLGRVLVRPRAWLIAHGELPLDADAAARFAALCARRAAGEPLAYLVGEKEFHGLTLHINARVLVPRPETEGLVDWALELLAAMPVDAAVADLGTGSGAIALAIAHARRDVRMCAVERSPEALALAQHNGARLGLAVEWLQGDWWTPLTGRQFDLIVSNPPYIAAADPHLQALAHEPAAALSPGAEGLEALRAIARDAARHLRPGAWLLLEHGHEQGDAVRALLRAGGLAEVSTRADLAGLPRCSAGRLAS